MADNSQLRRSVTAVVNPDGTAEVTVDGDSHRIVTAGPEDARSEAVGYIVQTVATPAGRPVPVHLVDCGRDSEVMVHLDGWVDERERQEARHSLPDGAGSDPATEPRVEPAAVGVPAASTGSVPVVGPPPPPIIQAAPATPPAPAPATESPSPTAHAAPAAPASPAPATESPSPAAPVDDEPATGPLPVVGAPAAPDSAPPSSRPSWARPATSVPPAPTCPPPSFPSGPGGPGPRDGTPAFAPPGRPGPSMAGQPGPSGPPPGHNGGPAGRHRPSDAPGPEQWSPGPPAPPPTLEDLLASRPAPAPGPAETGWRGRIRRLSGGAIKMAPGPAELAHRKAIQAVQRSLDGPKTIVVINTKGGGGKTTATYCLAATFGLHRGGYVLAWDDNETRGTLAWRAAQSRHTNTAVNLLRDLDRFEDARSARVGDLDNYVRSQGDAQFDVLASDEDAASAASIDATAFHALHRSLSRFYRVMIIDTGNNIKASNWQAAVEAADQVVIVSSIREDTAGGASWTLDSLMESGHVDKVAGAVTVLSAPSKVADTALAERFEDHFRRRTRAVLRVPYDPSLVDGGPIAIDRLSPDTREAWLLVAATIADNL